jgi:hypothetical protein
MSRQSPASRPRILDLMGNGAGVSTSARQEIAWPCHAFRVTLPVRQQGSLNLFEETVLRLLDLGRFDASKLANSTCLPLDLVEFILFRLQDRQLLAANNELTELAKEYLTLKENSPPDYEGRILFRELVGGRLLPILWKGDLRCETLVEWNPFKIVIEQGTTGKPIPRKLRIIRQNKDTQRPVHPSVLDVLAVLRQHQRLNRQYALLRGAAPADIAVQAGQISVVPNAESYLLRCQLIIPEGSTEFLVTDPFGYGCSDVLESAYREWISTDNEEEQNVLWLKEQAISQRTGRPETGENPSLAPKVAREYPELGRLFRSISRTRKQSKNATDTREQEAALATDRQRLVQDLYSAIEWALRYCLDTSRDDSQIQLLLSGTSESNAEVLAKMARTIGFVSADLGYLLKVSPGRVRSFEYGATDMQSLLAVAIASAHPNALHPLRRLASAMPDWLQCITIIKRDRDPAAHGQTTLLAAEHLEAHYSLTLETIRILLPKAVSDIGASDTAKSIIPAQVEYEARMAARISLERILGVQACKLLGTNISNLLVGVERLSSELPENGEVEAGSMIGDLCAALQLTIQQIVAAFKGIPSKATEDSIATAERKAREAEFLLEKGRLPRSIATVRRNGIEQALAGLSPSLGACIVALLLSASEQWLRQAAQRLPEYLLVIARAADLRGHGNRSIRIQTQELIHLKEDIYQTIKTTTMT